MYKCKDYADKCLPCKDYTYKCLVLNSLIPVLSKFSCGFNTIGMCILKACPQCILVKLHRMSSYIEYQTLRLSMQSPKALIWVRCASWPWPYLKSCHKAHILTCIGSISAWANTHFAWAMLVENLSLELSDCWTCKSTFASVQCDRSYLCFHMGR